MDIGHLAMQLLTGLQLGAIYILIALGLTLIFGTLGVANFAHGALYMIGAYAAWVMAGEYSWWLAVVATPVALFAIGVVLERGLIRFFYERPVTDQILVTFGLAIVIQELIRWMFGSSTQPFMPPMWALVPTDIGIGLYPPWRLLIIAVTVVVVLGLYGLLNFTRFGLVVRAGMRDDQMVRFLGINLSARFTIIFGLGAFLAGVAGIMGGPTAAVSPGMGMAFLVPSFLVVVTGGMGSIAGAIVAGLLFGEAQALMTLFIPSMSYVIIYLVAAVVLSIMPRGLFGAKGLME